LRTFFEQFEDLALSCALTDSEKCRAVLQYVDNTAKRSWQAFPAYNIGDFEALKATIFETYPGSIKPRNDRITSPKRPVHTVT